MKGFGNIKSFGDMVKQAQKMQKQMEQVQAQLAEEEHEASAGGGVVRAVVDGQLMLKKLEISPEALADGDASMLEDLILTAIGQAQRTADERRKEALGGITGGMNLPF